MKIIAEENKIVWDKEDFLSGFSPSVDVGPGTRFWNETGASAMLNFDPHTSNLGIAYPGPLVTSVGTAPAAVLVSAESDDTSVNAYMLGIEVHKYDTSTDTLASSSGFPHTISHSGHASTTGALGQVVAHRTQGTASAIFYSFNDATDGDVGVYYPVSGQFHDTFMSAAATGGAVMTAGKAHPIFITSDDLLLIGDVNKVHVYKQSSDTLSRNVLNLPSNFEVVGFVEDPIGYDTWVFATTARGTNRRGRAKSFAWSIDRPASYYKSPPIPDDEVAAPFILDGMIGCFTKSRSLGHKSVLRIYDNGEWKPKYYFSGDLPAPGGVDIENNTVIFNSSGVLHRWGSYASRINTAANQYVTISSGNSGFLRMIGTNSTTTSVYSSSGSSSNGVVKLGSGYATSASWQGVMARPDLPFGKKMRVRSAVVYLHSGGSTTRSLQLDIVTEGFSSPLNVFSSFLGTSATSSTVIAYQQDNFGTRDDTPTAHFAPLFSWGTGSGSTSASGVERVEIYYDLVDFARS